MVVVLICKKGLASRRYVHTCVEWEIEYVYNNNNNNNNNNDNSDN